MSYFQNHKIRKQNVKVTANVQDAFALKRKIELLMERVNLEMDSLLDEFVSEKEWLQIDRIEINIDGLSEKNLEETLVKKILSGLREKIETIKFNKTQVDDDKMGLEVISFHQKVFVAFLYFLEYGIFPWWYEPGSHDLFEEQVEQSLSTMTDENNSDQTKRASAKLVALLGNFAAQIRLTAQFSEKVFLRSIHLCLTAINLNAFQELESLYKILCKSIEESATKTNLQQKAKQIIYDSKVMLIQKIRSPNSQEKFIHLWLQDVLHKTEALSLDELESAILNNVDLRKYLPENMKNRESETLYLKNTRGNDIPGKAYIRKEKELPSVKTNELLRELDHTDGAIVFNAGLIIVAPFLPELFTKCGILEEQGITDKNKALAIMHYIVFGNCQYREYDVLLNKILCGMAENIPIEIVGDLAGDEKEEIHTMLTTAIGYWATLKSTSPDGLREGFLQRKGKLIHAHEEWILQVEVNAIDALLRVLPWTIGMIKLPWMKKMLRSRWI